MKHQINPRPFELLGIPEFPASSLQINAQLYDQAASVFSGHDQPIVPAWSMWDKSCRLAQWHYLLGNWDLCRLWSERAANASLECVRKTLVSPLPESYALNDDHSFATFGIMVDDHQNLRDRKWTHFIESGFCWALVGNHDSLLCHISEFPLDDLPRDDLPNVEFCLGLQSFCSGGVSTPHFSQVVRSEKADTRMVDLSLAMLAIVDNKERDYSAALESALRSHLRKREIQPFGNQVPVFPLHATTVWHLAERSGYYPNLLPFIQHYLFVIQDPDSSTQTDRSARVAASVPEAKTPADQLAIVDHDFQFALAKYKKAESKFIIDYKREEVPSSMTTWSYKVTLHSFLSGQFDICNEWCRVYCHAALLQLTGEWYQDPEQDHEAIGPFKHGNGSWGTLLEQGLAWAGIGGYWDGVDRLLRFPHQQMEPPEGGEAFRLYYLGLARWWKNSNDLTWIQEVKTKKGANLLVQQLESLARADEKTFAQATNKYLTNFLRRSGRGDYEFPYKAIFNWHLAKRAGLQPKISAKNRPFLFELPD